MAIIAKVTKAIMPVMTKIAFLPTMTLMTKMAVVDEYLLVILIYTY